MYTEHIHQPIVGQNYLTKGLLYNIVLNILCNLLNTVLKVKNRIVAWVQNGGSVLFSPPDRMADWELWLTAPPSITREYHTAYH